MEIKRFFVTPDALVDIANLLELILRLENHRVSLVHLVHTLTFALVVLGILLGLGLHAVNLVLRQTRRSLDADGLLLTGSLILGRNLQDTVGVDVEGHLNLRNTTTCGSDTCEVELADRLVL